MELAKIKGAVAPGGQLRLTQSFHAFIFECAGGLRISAQTGREGVIEEDSIRALRRISADLLGKHETIEVDVRPSIQKSPHTSKFLTFACSTKDNFSFSTVSINRKVTHYSLGPSLGGLRGQSIMRTLDEQ